MVTVHGPQEPAFWARSAGAVGKNRRFLRGATSESLFLGGNTRFARERVRILDVSCDGHDPKAQPSCGSYGLRRIIGWPNYLGYNPVNGVYGHNAHFERDFIDRETFMGERTLTETPVVFEPGRGQWVLGHTQCYDNNTFEHRHIMRGEGMNFLSADFHAEYRRVDNTVLGGSFSGGC